MVIASSNRIPLPRHAHLSPRRRPSGRPADAEDKLAFYDEKGALLAKETVTAARDPERVGQVLSAAIDCRRSVAERN
jgi:hypothetical protein